MENILSQNKENLNVALDLGKNEVKGFSYNNQGHIKKVVNFDSIMKKTLTSHILNPDIHPNKFKVEFEGKKYELGDGIENGNYSNENSKVNFHHKLCLLVALASLIDYDGQNIDVSVGMPSSHISNPQEKKAYEELLKGEEGKTISITINGAFKNFTINSIIPVSEGLATLPRLELMFSNNPYNIAVIDIGGHNFNLRLFSNTGYSLDERGVSEEQVGINTLLNNLHSELLSNLKDRDRKINRTDLRNFVKNRDLYPDMELSDYNGTNKQFIDEFVKNYIEEYITDKLSARSIKINTKGQIYLLTGGGALLLKPYFEEIYPNNLDFIKFSSTSKWDNCISFALNTLFQKNTNRVEIFNVLSNDALNKLSQHDKDLNDNFSDFFKNIMTETTNI